MADGVEVFDAATYEAALALLAERARELGLALTELAAVPGGLRPFLRPAPVRGSQRG